MTGFGGLHGDALARARQFVDERKDGGVVCPCCNRFLKVYRRSITTTTARWLIELVRRFQREPRAYATAEQWAIDINRGAGDTAKLRFWGLVYAAMVVEGNGKLGRTRTSGLWTPSNDGIEFVHGRLAVPRHAVVGNNQLIRLEGPLVTIHEVLGTGFDYAKLMAGGS